MKLPSFWRYTIDEHDADERLGIGVDWTLHREGPSRSFPHPDKPYYDYIQLIFKLGKHQLRCDIYYKCMPYKNYKEYIDYLRVSGYYK